MKLRLNVWLYKVRQNTIHGVTPTKVIFGIPFINGFGFVEKYVDHRFFKEREDFEDVTPEEFKKIENECKKVLIKVPGGIGDSLFATPMIDALQLKYGEKLKIDLFGSKYALEVLLHNPRVAKFIAEPVMHFEKLQSEYDDVFDLGCTIENNPEAEFENAYKVTSDTFNLTPPDYNPIVYVQPNEMKNAKNYIADLGVPLDSIKIGVHIESTSPLRTFPRNKVRSLLDNLAEFADVFMFSTNGQHKGRQDFECGKCKKKDSIVLHDNVSKLNFKCNGCTNPIEIVKEKENPKVHHIIGKHMRQTVAMINEMHMMICIDSGLLHIASGLEKPILALFSNFDGALRTSFFKNCVTMNTEYRCAPCHLNNVPRCPPMLRMNLSEPPCTNEFKVDEIVKYARFIIDQKGKDFTPMHIGAPPPVRIERKECTVCGWPDLNIIARKKDVAHARCLKCESIIALSPSPKDAYIEDDYHSVFNDERILNENFEFGKNLGKEISKLIGSSTANRVMEIGCSNGSTLKGFSESGWVPYGIEISPKVVETIKYPWKSNIFVGDLYSVVDENGKKEWNWPGRSPIKTIKNEDGTETKNLRLNIFECVLMQHSFEHFDDPLKAFQYASSLVGPNGYLVVQGPSASVMNKIGTSKNIHLNTLIPGEHQCIMSKKAFIELAEASGYQVVQYDENSINYCMFSILRKKD